MANSEKTRTLSTTRTTFRIIDELKAQDGARVTELAEGLELAPSTVHSHLATLLEDGYIAKEGDV